MKAWALLPLRTEEAKRIGLCACGHHFYNWALAIWFEKQVDGSATEVALREQTELYRDCFTGRGPDYVQ